MSVMGQADNFWIATQQLMRLDKPIGSLLLGWPTAIGLRLASGGLPSTKILLIFGLGTVLMRTAGCVLNDWADRNYDAHITRTRTRPLAQKRLKAGFALGLAALISLVALGMVCQTNKLTILYALVAASLAALYPFCKRFMPIPQLVLGLAFSMGIVMSFAAIQNTVPRYAFFLLLANTLWTLAYDTQYALVDRADDLKIGIKSSAIYFKDKTRLIINLCHSLHLLIYLCIGLNQDFHLSFYLGLACAGCLVVYQDSLCKNEEPKACFKAFLNNNYLGLSLFLGVVVGTW